ncbi:hypothetical protein AeNC1_000125 [Aphanomyces euteiches]|nr:hypothetical protein AeNC1_000125 [Aphanomyces euteiches]
MFILADFPCKSLHASMTSTRPRELDRVHLPAELIHKIAFYIREPETLFSLLEILRSMNLLGPFEHLWQLSLVKNQLELWPKLVVTRKDSSLTAESLAHLEAFAKYYTQVQIAYTNIPVLNDVAWISKSFNPMATQEWQINVSVSEEYLNELTRLRIVSLRLFFFFTRGPVLSSLSKLLHLTRLVMDVSEEWMDEVLDFAANSRQLVD